MSKTADYYLDSKLIARQPVTLYQSPSDTSPVLKKFGRGEQVGMIQSWVVRNGQVWWDVNWFSGKHAGWVKHVPGLFDKEIIEQTSSGQTHTTTVEKQIATTKDDDVLTKITDAAGNVVTGVGDAVAGTGSLLSNIGKNLTTIIIVILVIALIIAFIYGSQLLKA